MNGFGRNFNREDGPGGKAASTQEGLIMREGCGLVDDWRDDLSWLEQRIRFDPLWLSIAIGLLMYKSRHDRLTTREVLSPRSPDKAQKRASSTNPA